MDFTLSYEEIFISHRILKKMLDKKNLENFNNLFCISLKERKHLTDLLDNLN